MLVLKSVGDSIAITLTINWLASQSMVLKPGPDCTVRLGKPRTGHFYSLFNMKNWSMQKKTMNYTDCGPTAWFCESWLVQVVHTGPLFQALNGTILDSLPCFFFSLYGVVWTLEFDYSLKQETLTSLSELFASLSHSNYISHLCLSPSLSSAMTSSAQNAACLTLWALCLSPSSLSATTDLNPDHSSPHSHLCLSPSSPLATALSFVKLDQVK